MTIQNQFFDSLDSLPLGHFQRGTGKLVIPDHEIQGLHHFLRVLGVVPVRVLVVDGLNAHGIHVGVQLLHRSQKLGPGDAHVALKRLAG